MGAVLRAHMSAEGPAGAAEEPLEPDALAAGLEEAYR